MRHDQKRLLTRTSFAFGETEMTYSFRHGASVQDLVVDYFELAPTRSHAAVRDWSRFQLGLLLLITGAIAIIAQTRLAGFTPLSLLWLAPGAVVLGVFASIQSHFLVLEAAGNPLWIIDDKSRHQIVAEIDRRRRDRLADIYGPLNLANEPYLEIRKIEWLVEQSVFTREQADDQIRQVDAAAIARIVAAGEADYPIAPAIFAREAIAI